MGKTLWTRIGAILTAFAGIPFVIGTYSAPAGHAIHMADWFYILCCAFGLAGPIVIGFGASGNISSDQIKQVVNDHLAAQPQQQGGPVQNEEAGKKA